jgi:hypothetical protein
MLVRKISILIIIIIVLLELYIHYCVKLEVDSSNFTNTELEKVKEIIIVNKKPWDKIKETKDNNYYYINIIKFDEVKFIEWKDLIPDLEYDITNKLLKISSKDEERAMSIVNLMISNMKGDIEMEEIIKNDLINKSIIKSRKYNVVFIKITNLVLENNVNDNNDTLNNINIDTLKDTLKDINKSMNIDTFNINNKIIENKSIENKSIENKSIENKLVKSIKPEDYNYDGFNNSHFNLFRKDKLIRNNLSSGAYIGKQYARPFRR